MKKFQIAVLALTVTVLSTVGAWAQTTPANYQQRSLLSQDGGFQGRVTIASLVAAIAVVTEADTVVNHAIRVKLAGYVLKEPEFAARRLGILLAATVPAVVDAQGVVSTTLTDEQLLAVITSRWTAIATALVPATSGA